MLHIKPRRKNVKNVFFHVDLQRKKLIKCPATLVVTKQQSDNQQLQEIIYE